MMLKACEVKKGFGLFTAYFTAFDRLLETYLPRLRAHFVACRLDSRLYLFDWLFTIFSRSLPIEANLRVWDLFFRDGESALILAALGIMRMYEEKLLVSDFDQLASFLTGPMPADMSPEELANAMRSFGLRKRTIRSVIAGSRREARAAEAGNQPASSFGKKQASPDAVRSPKASNASAHSPVNHTQSPTFSQHENLPSEKSGGHSLSNGSSRSLSSVSLDLGDGGEIWDLNMDDLRPANGLHRVATIANDLESGAKRSISEPSSDRLRRTSETPEPSSGRNGKTPFFTRLMLLQRQSSMEEWSSLVRSDFPRGDIEVPDGACSKFLFTH
ncbi:unnamed protein product [Dibothriocephalus latus]|uniref:Rab-GAP TBC domain-containing protein n=1 Tax=Dibothriocephalus latus TaxID=60516 RepID=A0A3P7NXY6_DIBLA|nr:unnamed protein product [Dibothriocephalus latus]